MQARVILNRTRLMCLALLAAAAFATATEQAPPVETHWQRVLSGDRKVGSVVHTRRVEQGRVHETETLTLQLGNATRRMTYRSQLDTESSLQGDLLRIRRESRTPEGHTLIDARREGPDLVIDIGVGAGRQTRTLKAVGALRSEEFTRSWREAVGSGGQQEPMAYQAFDASKLAVVDVLLTQVKDADRPLVSRRVKAGPVDIVTLQALDSRGQVIDESMRLGGLALRLIGSSEAASQERNEKLDHIVGQTQKSPYRIPARDMREKIRYGFEHGAVAPRIPTGAGQRSWHEGQTTWIQVCAACPLDNVALGTDEHARALAATPWLNFGGNPVEARALRLTAGTDDPAEKMRRLTRYVRGHMSATEISMLGYGTALEAFRSRRGDCTEYAVLLAAMGRAAGVPTRVVSGMAYARQFEGQRHVFVPHAWVHAWTGSGWQSFDAALGSFDSTHLAFAVSDDGNPAQLFAGLNLAHELRLKSAARVVAAPVR